MKMAIRKRHRGATNGASNGSDTDHARHLIDIRAVEKAYQTPAGPFPALRGVDLQVDRGEFVAVIGKSGSGKSTLINMLTGIDRPTAGEVWVAGTNLGNMKEGKLAEWRGRNVGVVFQFFQLLPTLTNLENVMLPMDFCGVFSPREWPQRALQLLAEVGVEEHAGKLPTEISGGQQQRVAIARALATDPPIVVADEPTGNLDSKTAEAIFQLFERLVDQGKTFFIVTHDRDLAKRATRTIILADGEIVDEYLARAFPSLTEEQLLEATRNLEPAHYAKDETILEAGAPPDRLYVITKGVVEVSIPAPGEDVLAARLGTGQCFGEIELLRGGQNLANVRAASAAGVDVVTLSRSRFENLIAYASSAREELDRLVEQRIAENRAAREKAG
jgi:putative ABC transport system ATP-binding protein